MIARRIEAVCQLCVIVELLQDQELKVEKGSSLFRTHRFLANTIRVLLAAGEIDG